MAYNISERLVKYIVPKIFPAHHGLFLAALI